MYRIILISLLTGLSSHSMAELVEIGSDKSITIYADPATIQRVGSKVIMSEMGDFKSANATGGKSFLSMRKQQEYECKDKQMRTLRINLYAGNMGRGELVHTDHQSRNWEAVSPGSYGDFLWRTACKKP